MTAEAQQRVLKETWGMSLWEAIELLEVKQRVIDNRRADATTLAIIHELRLIEIRKCNKILEEIYEE